jgi:pilus assembly protein Flp/PilA
MNRPLSTRSFCDFVRDDSGATAIEYALIAAGIAIAIVAAVMGLGTALQAKYQSVSNAFN